MAERRVEARARRRGAAGRSRRYAAHRENATGWRRHLRGWQPGLVAVGLALLAALVAVPRPAEPRELPMPRIDRQQLAREAAIEATRAAAARTTTLPYDVRAAGEALRGYGLASGAQDAAGSARKLAELRRATAKARARYGDDLLLRLRAVQTEMFLEGLALFESTGEVNETLRQLGGDFPEKAGRAGWLDDRGRFLADATERAVLFRVRWSQLAGLIEQHPFSPTLNEWRVYYAFTLAHPTPAAAPGEASKLQLRFVQALERVDPDYPGALARGVLLYRLGSYQTATEAFRQHLRAHPSLSLIHI